MDGFIVSPPSTIPVAPMLSKSLRLPSPATTATTAVRRSSDPGMREPFLALRRLQRACSRSRRARWCRRQCLPLSAAPGSSVWTCALSADSSPTTSSESPSGARSRSSAARSSPWPSTTKPCSSGSAKPPGVRRPAAGATRARGASGSGSPREVGGDPAHDLDEARGAGVDDARVPQYARVAPASGRQPRRRG